MVTRPANSLWLRSAAFDWGWMILPGLLCLLLVIPYGLWGAAVVMPLYTVYLVFFGLPHNYLTWSAILPPSTRGRVSWAPLNASILVSLVSCVVVALTLGSALSEWILSAVALLSIWHVYRQHHGIAKIYDAVQSRRTGDATLFADRKALNLFFGLASLGVVVWAFTHEELSILMASDESYRFIHPVIPWPLFQLYLVVTAAIGAWGLKRAVWDRARAGKHLPWPQLALVAMGVITFWLPYAFLPLSAMPLAMAIATIFHNVQYFAFVWLFERQRSLALETEGLTLALPQRLAREGAWKRYFALGFAFSAIVISLYLAMPKAIGVFVIYFIAVSHYLVDGYIWRRNVSRDVSPFVAALARIG